PASLIPSIRYRYPRLREIPDDREHKIPLDRRIIGLRDKTTAYIPVKPVVLIQEVVYRRLQHQLIVFQQFFPDPSIHEKHIVIRREGHRLRPDIQIGIAMDLYMPRQE